MKRLLILLAFLPLFGYGQIKVSEMTSATIINSVDYFLLVQSGASKKAPYSLLSSQDADQISDSLVNYVTRLELTDSLDVIRTSISNYGTDNQIPFMNIGGTNFEYSSDFTWNGLRLDLKSSVGTGNVFIGDSTGRVTTGSFNTFYGLNSGYTNITGSSNVFNGYQAGYLTLSGNTNTFIGRESGYTNSTSSGNTYLGYQSGRQSTGSNNIFLGYQSGYSETGSNKLYIENSTSVTPLIYGEFDNNYVKISDSLEISRSLKFSQNDVESYSQGKLYYDTITDALSFYNDIPDFTHQLGYELTKRVFNNTASTIADGRFVRRTGTHENNARIATIALSGNSTPDSAQVFGITTVEIPADSYGIITIIGDVNNLDLQTLNEDAFYLGHAGLPIDTAPPPPYFSVCGGEVIYADNDSGILAVNIFLPTLTPSPLISMDTSDLSEAVTINTQNIYEYIPIGSVSVLNNNFGFTVAGDSIQVGVTGYYQIVLSSSFQGNPTAETWNYGVFINNDLQHKKTRTTSSSDAGDINVPISRRLIKDDWISFRIRNTTGTGNPTIVDLAYQILFLHE